LQAAEVKFLSLSFSLPSALPEASPFHSLEALPAETRCKGKNFYLVCKQSIGISFPFPCLTGNHSSLLPNLSKSPSFAPAPTDRECKGKAAKPAFQSNYSKLFIDDGV
jgi:hypothetical protein